MQAPPAPPKKRAQSKFFPEVGDDAPIPPQEDSIAWFKHEREKQRAEEREKWRTDNEAAKARAADARAMRFVPRSFCEFCTWLGVELTPGQRAVARVAYDGEDVGHDPIAQRAWGPLTEIPVDARSVVVVVKGARAGGSYVLVGLRLLHLALTVDVSGLAPGEEAAALIIAPTLRMARQTLRFAHGAAVKRPEIRERVPKLERSRAGDGFSIERDGVRVAISCAPAARGGTGGRAVSLVAAALDESAFFLDESAVVNDVEIYRAVRPRILTGGQVVIVSTPWAESGLIHELFRTNHGRPTKCIAAHAPTLFLRDTPGMRAIVASERARDPDNAAREFDAEFMSGSATGFFSRGALAQAIDAGRTGDEPVNPAAIVGVGVDFGFRRDHSAIVVVQRVGSVLSVACMRELRPERGKPLKPSEVCAEFALVAKRYGATLLLADSHYRESAREHLEPHDIVVEPAPEGQDGKAQTYVATRAALAEGRLRLPDEPRLLAQLGAVVAHPTAGGGLSVSLPRRAGDGHGDVVSALVLAVWRALSLAPVEYRSLTAASRMAGTQRRDGPSPPMVEESEEYEAGDAGPPPALW